MAPAATSASGAFAFCDIAGFTAFTAERGDDAAIDLVARFRSHVADGLPTGARIVNRIGDGVLVHFGDPGPAVPALLALTELCSDAATLDAPLWIRTGVHVGTARVLGDDLIGHDVNVAARVGELAGAAEVLVTERALADVGAEVRFDAVGPVFVKGVPDALRVYRASTTEPASPTTVR